LLAQITLESVKALAVIAQKAVYTGAVLTRTRAAVVDLRLAVGARVAGQAAADKTGLVSL